MPLARRCGNAPAELFGAHINLGKHMKIRYAPLAVACALMVAAAATTTAQAAAVTYYFGGTLDYVVGVPSLSVGDSFTGSFTFESTSANLNSFPSPNTADYVDSSNAIEVTVNGYSFSSTNTSACGSLGCGGIRVYNDVPTLGDHFEASNSVYGIPAPVTGPNLAGLGTSLSLFLGLQDSTGTVFNSTALPLSLTLSSFDQTHFGLINGSSGSPFGSLTYLSTTAPVPEASTTAMLALGLSALAFVRRRKSH